MNAKEKQLLIQMQNELQKERQCCDMLADALIQGGLDRSFEALTFHELLRNGVQYPGATLGKPRAKRAPRRRNPNHPTMGYYIAGNDPNFKFDFKPFNQDEETED
jgi:hypothetical protein